MVGKGSQWQSTEDIRDGFWGGSVFFQNPRSGEFGGTRIKH